MPGSPKATAAEVLRHAREQALFEAALLLEEPERERYLRDLCADDAALHARLMRLLSHQQRAGTPLDQPVLPRTASLAPGSEIGPYRLLQRLGEGGVGVVYLAEQAGALRRLVALKIIKPGMDSSEIISRFEAERQALALMDHPGIAKIHDAGSTPDGHPYFAMELISGAPVNLYCDARRLGTAARVGILIQICRALRHAHERGVIHRDIKPSNILVSTVDDLPVPKLIDFGIAKALQVRLTEKTFCTQAYAFLGTPAYMSPEQLAAEENHVDARCDVYGLGALAYVLLTGQGLYETKAGLEEQLRCIREQVPTPPSRRVRQLGAEPARLLARQRDCSLEELVRSLEGGLDAIVMRCLRKRRESRYQGAGELAAALEQHLAGDRELRIDALHTVGGWLRRVVSRLGTATIARPGPDATGEHTPQTHLTQSSGPPLEASLDLRRAEAHRLVLEGRRHYNQFEEPGLSQAQDSFEKALQVCPDYAPAYASLAALWSRRAILSWLHTRHLSVELARAETYAWRALEKDPAIAEPSVHLGMVCFLRGQLEQANTHFRHAVAGDPNLEIGWGYHSLLLRRLGRPDLGLKEIEISRLLRPAIFHIHHGCTLMELGRHDEAVALFEECERQNRGTHHTRAFQALALAWLGRKEEALQVARNSTEESLRAGWSPAANAWADGIAACALAEAGAGEQALALAMALQQQAEEHRFPAGFPLALLNQTEKAAALLEGTPEHLLDSVLMLLHHHAGLQNDPHLRELISSRRLQEALLTLASVLRGMPPEDPGHGFPPKLT